MSTETDLQRETALRDLDRFIEAREGSGPVAWETARRIMDRMIDTLSGDDRTPGYAAMIILGWMEDHPEYQDQMKRLIGAS